MLLFALHVRFKGCDYSHIYAINDVNYFVLGWFCNEDS